MIRNFFKRNAKAATDGIPDYHLGPSYDGAGAQRLVYNPEFGLPMFMASGHGLATAALRVTQTPQVYYQLRVPHSSLGGIQAGRFSLQPLTTEEEA